MYRYGSVAVPNRLTTRVSSPTSPKPRPASSTPNRSATSPRTCASPARTPAARTSAVIRPSRRFLAASAHHARPGQARTTRPGRRNRRHSPPDLGRMRCPRPPPVAAVSLPEPGAPKVPPVVTTRWQLARDAAVRYQDVVVPWINGPFADALVGLLEPRPGASILDVGCGTGAAARTAAKAVGRSGRVVGLDSNAGMLQVARSTSQADGVGPEDPEPATIEWLEATGTAMPLAAATFGAVVSSQALQFIPETDAVA